MPLETATYISDLVTSNPAASDPLSNADDHLRLIKSTLKNTFPSITGPVTVTQAQLNSLASPVATFAVGGFYAGTTSGLLVQASAPTDLSMVAGGQLVVTFHQDHTTSFTGAVSVNGNVTATTLIGAGVVPIGGMIMWLSDTLPTVGTWCWANGGTLSRAGNGAALFAITGTAYGAGDGSTTFNVINMAEVVPVGKSGMGGAGSPGLLGSIASGVKTVLGSVMGADTHTLSIAQLPTITPAGTITNGAITLTNPGSAFYLTGSGSIVANSSPGGAFGTNGSTATASQATSTFSGTPFGGGAAHNNVQPSRVVNYIIRIG